MRCGSRWRRRDWLLAQGCEQFLFKYCSTFDSTPEGNIGPVAEALLDRLGADLAVVCPAFPATGRRLFMGHLFVGEKLLSESGMEKHPLTPMTDPDIRRWLRLQTQERGRPRASSTRYAQGRARLPMLSRPNAPAGVRLVVTDAVADERPDGARRSAGGPQAGHRRLRHRARPAAEFPPRRQARRAGNDRSRSQEARPSFSPAPARPPRSGRSRPISRRIPASRSIPTH